MKGLSEEERRGLKSPFRQLQAVLGGGSPAGLADPCGMVQVEL